MSWMDKRRKVRRASRRLELVGHEPLEQRYLLAAAPILGNAPPMLDSIPDATIAVGQPLTFTATATDSDGGTPLTFQLDPNETPAGATIDRTTGAFSWTPTAAQVGNFRFVVIVSDQNSRPLSDADVFRVQVSGENQPPVNSVPGNQFTSLNQPLIFSQENGNKISVADTDAGTGALQVTLGVTSGALSLSGTTGLTFTTGDGTGDASMVFTGTLANINTALAGLTFTPANNSTDEVTLTLTTNDQGNTGSGGAKSDTDTVLIRVSSINQPPVNSVPGAQTMNEDGTLVFSTASGNLISISDPDAGATNPVRVVLSATNGTLSLSGTTGLVFNSGDGSADASMDFTGTIGSINTALAGMSFVPTSNFSGAASLTITTNDQGHTGSGGALSDTDTVNITVNPVNDAPVNTVPVAQTLPTNGTLTFSAANGNAISVSDVDAGTSLVQVTMGVTNGTLSLSGTTGLLFTTGDGTGDASMVFTGTLANVNAALAGMTFAPTNNFTGNATLTLTTNDQGNTGSGGALSDTDTVTLTVQAVNAPPVNAVPTATQNVNEDSTLTFSAASSNAIQVSDPDAGTENVQVMLTVLHGTLSLSGTTGLTFTAPGDGTDDATMTFTGPLAAVNAALAGMTYRPALNYNGEDTLTIATSDLGHTGFGGAKTDTDNVSIQVAAVNDAPVLTIPGPQATQVNTALVLSSTTSTAISAADVDAGSGLLQVTLAIPAGEGTLTLSGVGGLSFSVGDGTADPTMTFNGTLAAINTALDGLIYTPPTDFNDDTTLTVTVSDQGNTGSGGAKSDQKVLNIAVGTVNDPPVNTVPSGPIAAASGVDRVIAGISLADPDAAKGTVRVTLSVLHGTLSLSLAVPGGVTAGQVTTNGTGSVVVDAPLAAINTTLAAANGLIYRSNTSYTGSETLTVLTDDLGNTGTGGNKTDTDTVEITVQAENQPPNLTTPAEQTIRVGDPFSFTITASDPDVPAQALAFQIDSIQEQPPGSNADEATLAPTTGVFNWTPTTPGRYVFVILVTDNGLPAKSDSEQFVINVQADNAPPVNTVPGAQSTPTNTALVFSTANSNVISVADPDAGTQTVRVTLAATHGTLTLSGTTGLTFGTGDGTGDPTMTFDGTLADINAALQGLSFAPTTDFTGTAEVTITTSDLGNTGFGGAKTDSDSITIAVGDTVNDPPVNTVPGAQTTNEDTARVFSSANSNLISVTDPDVGTSPLRVTLGVTTGTLTLSGVSGLTFTAGDGTGDATMTFTGTLSDVNAALAGLSYAPALNDTGDETLTITTSDQGATGSGGEQTDTDTVVITLTPQNDSPLFDAQDTKNTSTGQPFSFTAAVTDVEGGTLTWQIIEVTDEPTEPNNSATATIDPETGVFNWTPDTAGTYRFLLSVTDNGSPPLADTIEVTIVVGTPNAAPQNTVPGAQNLLEDTTLVFSSANSNAISVADADAGTDDVEVTLTAQEGGLTLGATGDLTFTVGDGTGDATMTFRGTLANVNTALSGLTFTPPANFSGATSISITTSDLGHNGSGGAKTDTDAVDITVTPVNDVPSFTVGANVDATVGEGARTIEGWATNISAGPGEGTQALSFQVGTDHPELFAVVPSVAPDGTLTFTPAASGAGGVANVSVILMDDGGTADGGDNASDAQDFMITIGVGANAPPVNTIPAQQQAVTEDVVSPLVFSAAGGNAISVADPDAGTGELQVTLTATGGTLTLSGVTGLAFTTGDGMGDATMTFTGTQSAINAALEGMTYSPNLNVVGAQMLTIATNDQGNTGSGGAKSDTDNVPISILPVNDAPVNTVPGAQTTLKNVALTLSAANSNVLSISDVDDGGLDFEITLSVTNGTLTLGSLTGLNFTNGDGANDATMTFSGSEAEVNTALDGLVFTPTTDFVGTATLTLQTSDQGNTGSGGTKTDSDNVEISVTDDSNAPPVNSLPAGPVVAETNVDQPIGPISVTDIDAGTANVQMTLAVEHGTLRVRTDVNGGLTGTQVTGNDSASVVLTGPIAAINATLAAFNGLVYRSAAAYTGADTLTVTSNDQGNTGSGGAKTDIDALGLSVIAGTGTLTGKVFNATAQSGFPGDGQPTLDGWTVFIDSDGDGTLNAGEPSTLTAGGGVYTFNNLVAGNYQLRAVPATGWQISAPTYYFLMDGSQETSDPETRAVGYGALVLTPDQTGMAYRVAFEGITGSTTGLHIHRGAPGVDGSVIYDLAAGAGLSPGFTSEVTGMMLIAAGDLTDLNAGNLYVNLHTTGFTGGEIRGQIVPGTVNAVALARGGTVATRDFFALDPESPFFSLQTGLANDTGASGGDTITNDPTVSGRVTDNALVASLKAGFDATPPASFIDITADVEPDGDFVLSPTRLNQINGGPLADGSHTLHLLATDAAGRTTMREVTFRLDTVATVTVDLAAGYSDTTPPDPIETFFRTVSLVGTAEPGSAVSLQGTSLTALSNVGGNYQIDGAPLSLASNALTVTYTDVAGNVATETLNVTRLEPVVDAGLTAALQADTGASGTDAWTSNPAISATIADLTGITAVEARLRRGTQSGVLNVPVGTGSYTFSATDLATAFGAALSDGPLQFTLRATKTGVPTPLEFTLFYTLDTTAPAAPSFGLAADDQTNPGNPLETNHELVDLVGTAEPGVTLSLLNTALAVVAGPDGSFTFANINLALGLNQPQITATDLAGNSSVPTTVDITRVAAPGGFAAPDSQLAATDSVFEDLDDLIDLD